MVNFLTKEKILQAAIHQFAVHGYQGATMRNIANEVGIKPASIYFFYKNKEALFLAAFESLLNNHFDEMKRIIEEKDGQPIKEVLAALMRGAVSFHLSNRHEMNAYITLITSPPPEILQLLQKHVQKFDKWLTDTLLALIHRDNQHLTDKQAERIVRQFAILIDGVFWEINLYEKHELDEQIEEAIYILELLLGGKSK